MSDSVFTVGTRVQYRHGRGLATGTIVEVTPDGRAIIKTKNQHQVARRIECLALAKEESK